MSALEEKARQALELLPLTSDQVDIFERLVDEIAEIGGSAAARELLLLLDDECDLAGVVQAVTITLQSFPANELVPALLSSLEVAALRSPRGLSDVLRWLVSSDASRRLLAEAASSLEPDTKAELKKLVVYVARSPRYANRCQELLESLA